MFLSCIYTHVYLESVAFLREAIIGYIVKREWWPLWASSAEDHNKHSIVIHFLSLSSYLIMVISFAGGKVVGQGKKGPVISPSVASQLQGWPPWPGAGACQQGPRRERGMEVFQSLCICHLSHASGPQALWIWICQPESSPALQHLWTWICPEWLFNPTSLHCSPVQQLTLKCVWGGGVPRGLVAAGWLLSAANLTVWPPPLLWGDLSMSISVNMCASS